MRSKGVGQLELEGSSLLGRQKGRPELGGSVMKVNQLAWQRCAPATLRREAERVGVGCENHMLWEGAGPSKDVLVEEFRDSCSLSEEIKSATGSGASSQLESSLCIEHLRGVSAERGERRAEKRQREVPRIFPAEPGGLSASCSRRPGRTATTDQREPMSRLNIFMLMVEENGNVERAGKLTAVAASAPAAGEKKGKSLAAASAPALAQKWKKKGQDREVVVVALLKGVSEGPKALLMKCAKPMEDGPTKMGEGDWARGLQEAVKPGSRQPAKGRLIGLVEEKGIKEIWASLDRAPDLFDQHELQTVAVQGAVGMPWAESLGWAKYGSEGQDMAPLVGSWMSLPHRVARGKRLCSLLGRVQHSEGGRMRCHSGEAWLAVILWASWCTPVEAMQNGPAGPGVIPAFPAVVVAAGALAAVRGLVDALGGRREVARQSGQVVDLERAEENVGVVNPSVLPGSAMVEAAKKLRMKGLDVAVKEAKQLKVVTFNLHNRMGCHDGSGWLMLNSLIRETLVRLRCCAAARGGPPLPRAVAGVASILPLGRAGVPCVVGQLAANECSTKVKAAILVSRALSPSIVAWKLGREGTNGGSATANGGTDMVDCLRICPSQKEEAGCVKPLGRLERPWFATANRWRGLE